MRLIDADAFRREIDNHWPFTKEEQSKHGIADMAKSTLLCVLNQMPSVQLDWGKPVGDGRPLADGEIIARLQDIKKQIGGSYAIERAIEVLKALPSAQPERKKGTWEEIYDADENGEPYPCGAACSECGFLTISETDFCPNCGADMKGEDK